jgi:hypothetical protein
MTTPQPELPPRADPGARRRRPPASLVGQGAPCPVVRRGVPLPPGRRVRPARCRAGLPWPGRRRAGAPNPAGRLRPGGEAVQGALPAQRGHVPRDRRPAAPAADADAGVLRRVADAQRADHGPASRRGPSALRRRRLRVSLQPHPDDLVPGERGRGRRADRRVPDPAAVIVVADRASARRTGPGLPARGHRTLRTSPSPANARSPSRSSIRGRSGCTPSLDVEL